MVCQAKANCTACILIVWFLYANAKALEVSDKRCSGSPEQEIAEEQCPVRPQPSFMAMAIVASQHCTLPHNIANALFMLLNPLSGISPLLPGSFRKLPTDPREQSSVQITFEDMSSNRFLVTTLLLILWMACTETSPHLQRLSFENVNPGSFRKFSTDHQEHSSVQITFEAV